jgi:SAM-dependent methyltransferase
MTETDKMLAERYGAYASFATPTDPILTETHGDSSADEIDRLLNVFATPEARFLELGCGAGQTLCELAPKVQEIWGIDLEEPLLNGAKERVAAAGYTNTKLILGNTTNAEDVAQLPDAYFDFAFSRRGPFITAALKEKLMPDACVLVELYQDALGLKEIFGRRAFLPTDCFSGGDWAVSHHAGMGLLPVSVKEYFFEQYFRDADHFAAFLATITASLSHWWMEQRPFVPEQDRPALELYCRFNTTSKGIRLIQRRKVYLFRQAQTNYYPVDGWRD